MSAYSTSPLVNTQHYNRVAMWLHWTIAFLVLLNWPLGFFADSIKTAGGNLMPLHKSIGLTVLALTSVRLLWRLTHQPPSLPSSISRLKAAIATVSHRSLYGLLILVPLSGWLRVSPGRYPLIWFGLVTVPKFPIVPKTAPANLAATSHVVLAWVLLGFVALHVAAAWHHRYCLKDNVMARMFPLRTD